MLFKLIKHEIKHSVRYTLSIYCAVIAVAVVMGLSLLADSTVIGSLGCFALFITGIATVVVTLVSVVKSFNDTLYSRQGYLTFTLPVKCSTLLFSKVLVSFLWIVVSFVIMASTYILIFFYAKERTEGLLDTLVGAISVSGILEMLPSGKIIVQFLLVASLMAVFTILTYVGYVYFAVTIANTRALHAHPKFYGGVVFFAVFLFVNTISNKLTLALPLTFNVSYEKVYFALHNMSADADALITYGVGGTIFSFIVAIGLLLFTGYIMEHKVNVK